MKVDPRFADEIGREFALYGLAAPHYAESQRLMAQTVSSHLEGRLPRVLDLGCGTGSTTLALLEYSPRASVIAVDAEEVMLDQARKAFGQNDMVSVVCADALEYLRRCESLSVDAIISGYCWHNTPPEYRSSVFTEVGRVLKSSGIVANCDKIAQDSIVAHWVSFKAQMDAFQAFVEAGRSDLHEKWLEHYFEDDRIRLTEREQNMLFAQAGCGVITLHRRWWMDALFSAIKD